MMRHWHAEERQKVAEMLARGLSAAQIAPRFGRSRCAVISLVNRHRDLKSVGFAWNKRTEARV